MSTEHDLPSAVGIESDPNAVYALGSNTAESARLQRQADELAPDSRARWIALLCAPATAQSTSAEDRAASSNCSPNESCPAGG